MLDEKDHQILDILTENSRISCREISRKTRIPVMTVLNRLKRLEEEKFIHKYTAFLNLEKLGYNLICYVLITMDYDALKKLNRYQHEVMDEVVKHPAVLTAALVTGPARDAIVKIKARNIADLNKILDDFRNIPGLRRTDTMNVLYEARKETKLPIRGKKKNGTIVQKDEEELG